MDLFLVGHATDRTGGTGVTVVLFPKGAVAGCDVRGGAPGTRETDLLDAACFMEEVHAIVLTGGSAFGLAAADGVMGYCEKHGWGFDTGWGVVPIVPAACLFDLAVGDSRARPGPAMGVKACEAAGPLEESPMGNVGAGTGASIGKYSDPKRAMKSGLGWSSIEWGHVRVSAVMAVNAFGAAKDESGGLLAGARNAEGTLLSPAEALMEGEPPVSWGRNTTLGVVVTNAALTKAQCRRVAMEGQDGYADALFPVHTRFDGDTLFCVSAGQEPADPLRVGFLARMAVAGAIRSAVRSASSAYGLAGLAGPPLP
ncbi:MAG: P1 family peptidase [Synergistaceae bacterium]|nr:P1 family peptidase [Synergistaceae bacterium]